MQALPPAHLTGGIEAPAGIKDMGTYKRGVYTDEQQQRLGVDQDGKPVEKKVQALPPAHLTGGIEAPAGIKDMGTFTRGVYTDEQQQRLGVDQDGKPVEKKVKALPPAHLTGGMEAPAGTKDMGTFTRAVYSLEQKIRLAVDENGKKQSKTDLLLETAFINFDEDNDGTVSCEEFADFADTICGLGEHNILGGIGELSNEMVQTMIDGVDMNKDGILQMDEFKQLMTNLLSEIFGDIATNDTWHTFFCANFLTNNEAKAFGF